MAVDKPILYAYHKFKHKIHVDSSKPSALNPEELLAMLSLDLGLPNSELSPLLVIFLKQLPNQFSGVSTDLVPFAPHFSRQIQRRGKKRLR